MLRSYGDVWNCNIFGKCRYVDCQEEIISPPELYICERWKSTNQAAIRGLKPHEIFSLNAIRCRMLNTKFFGYFNILLTVI